MSCGRRLDRPDSLQFNPHTAEALEETDAVTSKIGTRWIWSSSCRPALGHWRMMLALPQMPTSLAPAAVLVRSSAASSPSVTKWYVVPPCIGISSRASCVSTKTGRSNGGGSPHGSTRTSNMRLPITIAPVRAYASSSTCASAAVPLCEHPIVQPAIAVAQRVADAIVRSGDEPIERHREFGSASSWNLLVSVAKERK